jgi:uncharacterized nucleotidyltransferase DUF6036
VVIQRLGPNDFRRDDPFVRALVDYFSRFATECGPPPRPVRGYLAGGLGVRCYAGTRVTGDIDMFFTGGRVLIPPNTTVLVSHQGGEHSLVFDHQYTPDFGLLHPDYDQRAVGLAASSWLELLVLHPVDLAITKVARFQDHDRSDIAALAGTRSFDRLALARLAEEAMAYAIGNLTFVRANLTGALDIVSTVQAERPA